MNSAKFLLLAFNNIGLLLLLSVFLSLFLYFATSRIAGGITDPFHFYYAFTFGTSYAVVGLLAIKEEIGFAEIALIAGYGIAFLVGYRLFSRLRPVSISRAVRSWGGGRTFFNTAITIYFIVAILYVSFAGLAFLSVSRFEANRGVGFLVRIMDPLRLFIIGYLAVRIGERRGKRAVWLICGTVCFALLSSLLNGAKLALLESAYVAAVALAISLGKKSLPLKQILWPALVVLLLTTGYALTQLFFNFKADTSAGSEDAQYIAGSPLLLEQFAVRIVSNGDMYYLGLPQPVLRSLHIEHPLLQLFGPMLGGGAVSALAGYDINNTDVGRQIILYWDPGYSVSGGPTNHFDLTAYVYFGPILGTMFVVLLAFILAQITQLKNYRYSIVGCSAVAALYCRSLAILLNPATGFALVVDAVIVFSVVSFLAKLLNSVTANPTSVPLVHARGTE